MSTEEFSSTLESLLAVKPPGVSGTKIRKLTQLAIGSVQSESVLVQKLYTHFKKTPSGNKLGVLYVVDAIVRGLFDEAKKADQTINQNSPEGTYAGGVTHIAFIVDGLIDDFVGSNQSVELLEKAIKVIGIWEKVGIFPIENVRSMKEKLEKELENQKENNDDGVPLLSTTPPGSPPAHVVATVASYKELARKYNKSNNSKPPADTASILQALASIAKQKNPAEVGPGSKPLPLPKAVSTGVITPIGGYPTDRRDVGDGRDRYERHPGQERRENDRYNHTRNRQDYSKPHSHSHSRSRSRSPPQTHRLSNNNPKNVKYDKSLPVGHIRVYSRTLFLGGILPDISEMDIKNTFAPYAKVQSVVFNQEKRHAFLKLYTRDDAVSSKTKVNELNARGGTSLRPRWGVGFGPRDCCDYQAGVSVVPLERLTDSDKKWAVTAENGGTGGLPLVETMCIEEPDIEVGAGIASKLISSSKSVDVNEDRNRYRERERGERDYGRRDSRDDRGRDKYSRASPPGPPIPGIPIPTSGGLPPGFPPLTSESLATMPPELREYMTKVVQQQNPQFAPTSQGVLPFPAVPGFSSIGVNQPQSRPQPTSVSPPPPTPPSASQFTLSPELALLLQKQNQK